MAAAGEPAEVRESLILLADEAELLAADPRPPRRVHRRQLIVAQRDRLHSSGAEP